MTTQLSCSFWSLVGERHLVSSRRPTSQSSTNLEIPSRATSWPSRSQFRLPAQWPCCRVWPWLAKSTVIAALRPSSVNCRSPTFLCEVFNSVFLHFSRPLLISVHFSTLPLQFLLQFFPVLCAIAFHIQLTLLPLCSSTFHQTNVEIAQHGSEDNLLISRIRSLHLLLEVDDHDEEEW